MKNNNTFKRVAAGALAAISVAGYTVPANVGGLLTNTNVLMANAEETAKAKKNAIAIDTSCTKLEESITSVSATIVEYGQVNPINLTSKGDIAQFFHGRNGLLVQGSKVTLESIVPLTINLGEVDYTTLPDGIAFDDSTSKKFYNSSQAYIKATNVDTIGSAPVDAYVKLSGGTGTCPFTTAPTTPVVGNVFTADGDKATTLENAKFIYGANNDTKWYEIKKVVAKGTNVTDTLVSVAPSYYEIVSDTDAISALFTATGTTPFDDFLYGLNENQKKAVAANSTIDGVNKKVTVAVPGYTSSGSDLVGYTYEFNVPQGDDDITASSTTASVKIKAEKTIFQTVAPTADISDLKKYNGTRLDWKKAVFAQSADREIKINKLTSANVKVISSADASGADAGSNNTAFQNEKIKIFADKNFGAWWWNGDENSQPEYDKAHFDTNVNSDTAGKYVLEIKAPYNTDGTTKPEIILTALPNTVDYTFSDNADVLYATGSGYTNGKAAEIKAKYTKTGETAPTTIDFNGTVPNGTVVTPELNVIPQLLVKNPEDATNYFSATLTRNKGTKTECIVTAKGGSTADKVTMAEILGAIYTAGTDGVGKPYFSMESDKKTIKGAGKYELAVTVYVNEYNAAGLATAVPKTVKYAWSIDTKEALTASDVVVQAEADAPVLVMDNGSEKSKIQLTGNPYGPIQFRASDKFKNNSVTMSAGYMDNSTTPPTFVPGSLKAKDGTTVNHVSVAGFTKQSELNDQRDLLVKFTDPEYSADEVVITVPYVISDNAVAGKIYIGDDISNATAYNNNSKNPNIKLSMDTIEKLEDKIYDTYYVTGIDESKVEFEYSEGKDKKVDVRELTKREIGLPNAVGNYTVFLTYDGDAFAAVNVEIAEHTMYFVPSEEALNLTFGDKLTFKTDYTATDINGKAVKADMPEVEFEIFKPAYDEDGNIITDKEGKPVIANTTERATDRRSQFYVAGNSDYPTFYTYRKGMPGKIAVKGDCDTTTAGYDGTYDLYKFAKNGGTAGTQDWDYNNAKDLYNAGTYIVRMSGSVNKNSGYIVEDQVFLLTIDQVGINENSFVIYPAVQAVNSNASLKVLTTARVGNNAYIEVSKKLADLGLQVAVTRGSEEDSTVGAHEINVSPTAACARNFKNTVKTNWYIIKQTSQNSLSGLTYIPEDTKLAGNGEVIIRYKRPEDNKLTSGTNATVKSFGIIYDTHAKLAAPKYSTNSEYKNLDFTYANRLASKHGGDTAFENAYAALQLGNGFSTTGDNNSTYNSNGSGARIEMPKDTSIGVWMRTYVLLSDGTIYYGDVKYVNLVEEATYFLNLKMGDQGKLATNPGVEAIDNKEAKTALGIKDSKITNTTDKINFRKKVQSGYNANDDTFYMYGSYTLTDNKLVTSDAVKQFGVIADTDGIYAAPTTAKPYGEDTQKISVKDGLKLRDDNIFAVGKSKADNPIYDTDEYGLKIKRTSNRSRVNGVWARGYVDLGEGIIVYTDPIYISSTSDYYTQYGKTRNAIDSTGEANIDLSIKQVVAGTGANKNYWFIKANGNINLGKIKGITSTSAIKQVGVVVDETGSLLTKDPTKGYILKETDGIKAADKKLVLGNGYKEGNFNNKAPNTTFDFMLPYKTDADGDDIPFVAREFVTLNIFGKDVTIYGNVISNVKETSVGGAPSKWEADNNWRNSPLGS